MKIPMPALMRSVLESRRWMDGEAALSIAMSLRRSVVLVLREVVATRRKKPKKQVTQTAQSIIHS
jgi:hypothetical protein